MNEYKYKINGHSYQVAINEVEGTVAKVEVNGKSYEVEMEQPVKATRKPVVAPVARPTATAAAPAAAPKPAAAHVAGKSGVKSPLPGVILEVKVAVGATVTKGQTIVILEAMKMENNINADKDGTVTAVLVNKGDSVLEGADLIIIE